MAYLKAGGPAIGSTAVTDVARGNDAHPALVALRNNTFGVAFSGAGFLTPYFIGVLKALEDLRIVHARTPMAGASGGALVTAMQKSRLPYDQRVTMCLELAEYFGQGRRVKGNLMRGVEGNLEDHLPAAAHKHCNDGSMHVAITRFNTRKFPLLEQKLLSSFRSRRDLIEALLASCHIPSYSSGSLTLNYRGLPHMDGGLSGFLPVPPGVEYALRVSILPCGKAATMPRVTGVPSSTKIDIAIDSFSSWPFDLYQTCQLKLAPSSPEFILALLDKGVHDVHCWAESIGYLAPVVHLKKLVVLPEPRQDPRHILVALRAIGLAAGYLSRHRVDLDTSPTSLSSTSSLLGSSGSLTGANMVVAAGLVLVAGTMMCMWGQVQLVIP